MLRKLRPWLQAMTIGSGGPPPNHRGPSLDVRHTSPTHSLRTLAIPVRPDLHFSATSPPSQYRPPVSRVPSPATWASTVLPAHTIPW